MSIRREGDTPIVALVPARAGSKGVPGKNVKPLCGKPLIAYTAELIKSLDIFDYALLSTESPQIAEMGRTFGLEAPFLRPDELARDDTPMLAVIEHALDWLERCGTRAAVIVLLQPTQPLRRAVDVVCALEMLQSKHCDSVVSVVAMPMHLSPDFVMRIDENGRLMPFLDRGAQITRRQDARPAYVRDGTIYAFHAETARRHKSIYGTVCLPIIIDPKWSINIDSQIDWEEAERRLGCR
jgi:CMP-N-acetylneuraminic acid synthetase